MTADARPDDVQDDETDDSDGGMTVAAVVVLVALCTVGAVGWLALMHRVGTGRGLW